MYYSVLNILMGSRQTPNFESRLKGDAKHLHTGNRFLKSCCLFLSVLWLFSGPAGAASPLAAYRIDEGKISVSGLSSGGYMAVQMHVAFSETFMGAGVIAGGTYLCAEGDVLKATGRCMNDADADLPPPGHFRELTMREAAAGRIDSVTHLSTDRIWLFTGGADDRVLTRVMDNLDGYYRLFAAGENIVYKRDALPNAQHAMITEDYGNACDHYGSPFINDCDYGAARELLHHIYGTLNPSVTTPPEHLIIFDQTEFSGSPYIGAEGYVYEPAECTDGSVACKLHVAFHGCSQNKDRVGDRFARHSGYNQWAESNGIIVLYPQTSLSATNQCWDWWSYGELGGEMRYHTKEGAQMAAVKAMVDRVRGLPGTALYCGMDTNAGHLAADRAYRWFIWFYFAKGSSDYLGMVGSTSNTLQETRPGYFVRVDSCL